MGTEKDTRDSLRRTPRKREKKELKSVCSKKRGRPSGVAVAWSHLSRAPIIERDDHLVHGFKVPGSVDQIAVQNSRMGSGAPRPGDEGGARKLRRRGLR